MKIIRTLFEESLRPTINGDDEIEFLAAGSTIFPVDALKTDPTAYKAEFKAWLNDMWLDRNRLQLGKILSLHGNAGRFSDLCAAVSSGNAVPAIGSGMSKASGFPMWREFLYRLQKYTSLTIADLDAMLNGGHYEEAVDRIATDAGMHLFDERIEQELRVDDASEITGPVRLLPALFPKLVLSTNLDDVLEHVYGASDSRFEFIHVGREIERYRQLESSGKGMLLKLHGDFRRKDGRVLGVAEYEAAYAAGSPARESLALISRTKTLLWMGCSLGIDRTVTLLRDVVAIDSHAPRHFAFLRLPKSDEVRVAREKELSQRMIFPIWYDGDDDQDIEALLVGILDRTGKLKSLEGT